MPDYKMHGAVALVSLQGGENSARASSRQPDHVYQDLMHVLQDVSVQAVVLYGNDDNFWGDGPLDSLSLEQPGGCLSVRALVEAVEHSPKPVTAAIGRSCMGAGFELALACHFRVVASDARFSMPEIQFGVLPAAGASQRLPRAFGFDAALNAMLSGKPVAFNRYSQTPLVHQVAEGDLLSTAVDFAAGASEGEKLRALPVSGVDHDLFAEYVRNASAAMPVSPRAVSAILDVLEAATGKSFDEGLALELSLARQLADSPEHQALRHAWLSEKKAHQITGLDLSKGVRAIASVGVVGGGTMGAGIAQAFINAGIPALLVDKSEAALERARKGMQAGYESQLRKGRIRESDIQARMALLTTTTDDSDLKDADLLIEAVFEDMAVKKSVFARLDEVAKPGAILASNTSTLDLDEIALVTSRPESVVGLHFFSPAHIMRLLEVVRGQKTGDGVLATAMHVGKTLGKVSVVSGVCDGFIGNRMVNQYLRTAMLLVQAGATPWQIDRALERWGMAMGPFRMSDLAGNDIGSAIFQRLETERPELEFAGLVHRMCEAGRLGQKTGKGWYRYEPGQRRPLEDSDTLELIAQSRQAAGVEPRRVSDQEIVERCIYALVNEGARLLDEGIAQRASDIDVVYLNGYGFPRWRGGPMFFASQTGLFRVARTMERFAEAGDSSFWQPAPLLVRLAQFNSTFEQPGAVQ